MESFILFILTAGFLTFLLAGIMLTVFKNRLAFNNRVMKYFEEPVKKQREDPEKNKENRWRNTFNRYWGIGTEFLNKKVSKNEQKKLELLLKDAGYPFKTALDFRLFQLLISVLACVPIFLFLLPAANNKMSVILLIVVMAILGFRLPIFYLGKKKTARIKEINKAMPDFFDTVNLLLEAGMGLDLALAEVSKKLKGPLSDEFLLTLEDMKLGKSRREAFYDLKKRVPSDSFQSMISSLIQADQLGIGMVKVLGNLTVRVREQRREAAREQAMKAPVKMLFPMVFFIFPSIFIVILGPLAIQLITNGLGR